jgi:hypothetical protein
MPGNLVKGSNVPVTPSTMSYRYVGLRLLEYDNNRWFVIPGRRDGLHSSVLIVKDSDDIAPCSTGSAKARSSPTTSSSAGTPAAIESRPPSRSAGASGFGRWRSWRPDSRPCVLGHAERGWVAAFVIHAVVVEGSDVGEGAVTARAVCSVDAVPALSAAGARHRQPAGLVSWHVLQGRAAVRQSCRTPTPPSRKRRRACTSRATSSPPSSCTGIRRRCWCRSACLSATDCRSSGWKRRARCSTRICRPTSSSREPADKQGELADLMCSLGYRSAAVTSCRYRMIRSCSAGSTGAI